MSNTMTLGSLFDGSAGFPLGGLLAGITPLWSSEIEPFPIRVTTKRLPFMKHYGDVSAINGDELSPVDIITFGSPCQDMSVAGKRSGLDGSRSSLFYQAVRIVKEMRCATNGRYPRYIVWENVPGAFSSNNGEDFRCVLETLCRVKDTEISIPRCEKWRPSGEILGDGFSLAWRQFDAQYWGVPQRRKRIYLVADFTGGGAGEILFESEGVSGYSAQGFRSWQRAANAFEEGVGETGGNLINAIPLENHPTDSRVKLSDDGKCQTLTSRMGTGGNNVPLLLKIRAGREGGGKGPLIQENRSATLSCNNDQTLFQPVAYGICSKDSNSMRSQNPKSGFYEADTSRCLDQNGGNPNCNQGGIAVVAIEGNGSRPSHKGDGYKETDAMYTLNATEQHGVAYSMTTGSFTQINEEKASTLMAMDYKQAQIVNDRASYGFYPQMKSESIAFTEEKSGCLVNGTNPGYQNGVLEADYIVRRLTPIECARLQGFPDWWCSDIATAEPTDEDIRFWSEVWETHRKIMGTSTKPKTEKQIIKWLKDPYSEAAEYKMWGNGVALPNVTFVLSGIAWASAKEE